MSVGSLFADPFCLTKFLSIEIIAAPEMARAASQNFTELFLSHIQCLHFHMECTSRSATNRLLPRFNAVDLKSPFLKSQNVHSIARLLSPTPLHMESPLVLRKTIPTLARTLNTIITSILIEDNCTFFFFSFIKLVFSTMGRYKCYTI